MNDMSRTSRVVTVTDQMGAGIWSVCKVAKKKPGESLGAFFFKQSLFRLHSSSRCGSQSLTPLSSILFIAVSSAVNDFIT